MEKPALEDIYSIYLRHPCVVTDSRKVTPGVFFFSLKGENYDGNQFISDALSKGCAAALTEDPACVVDERVILVENVLKVLQDLARMHRRQLNIPILAVTGSNGKTTTKELLHKVLGSFFCVGATGGNLNNHIGVPLTLLSFTDNMQLGIVEMGANHPGEIKQLCEIAEPSHGLITNVGRAHLEGFGGFEGVKKGKKELYDWIDSHSGVVFANAANPELVSMLAGYTSRLITFGDPMSSAPQVEAISADPLLKVLIDGIPVDTHLAGLYNVENIAAASCVGHYFGVPRALVLRAIEEYTPNNQRSQWMKTEKNALLCDFYNANPTSMRVAITNFLNTEAEPKMMILGDMFELGDFSREEHRQIALMLDACPELMVYWVGNNFAEVVTPAANRLVFRNTDELCGFLSQDPVQNFNIFIKGSRGGHLERLIPFL
jgi:UDP-N-acetylmuramoyl-tripeptide--D-alanyl-D-alanine ligase